MHQPLRYVMQMVSTVLRRVLQSIVEMRIHGVSPEFVREMGESGLGDLSFDDLIEMGTHGVDPDYIREMRENAA